MRRLLPLLLTGALFVGCGPHAEERVSNELEIDETSITLPSAKEAVPVFEVTVKKPVTLELERSLRRIKGVEVVAQIASKTLPIENAGTTRKLVVAAVDPILFRSLSPPSTRAADFVWVSLVMGRAAPTFDAAEKVGLGFGGNLDIGSVPFEVGAIADNGVPNFADILVQNGAADELHLGLPHTLIVGASPGASVDGIGNAIHNHLPQAKSRRLVESAEAPAQEGPAPTPMGQVSGGTIGSMTFQILKNGFIRPDSSWVQANIVHGEVPILGDVTCHRYLFPRLIGALGQIEESGLADLIDPAQYGGCYVPRFIDRDPNKPLSMHAFGLAVDLNVKDNPLGSAGTMDPAIVEIFENWGFEWGGRWARPDPMHFELR